MSEASFRAWKQAETERVLRLIGANLRRQRQAQRRKQSDLAQVIGRSRWVISAIERGQTNVTIGRLVALARALRLPLAALFEGVFNGPT